MSMSEIEEPEPPKPPRSPVKPLPRLWKSEPDEPEDEIPLDETTDRAAKSSSKGADGASSTSSSKPAKKKKKKEPAGGDPSQPKKVLVEDTPTLDTYESRRRARFMIGGLSATCAIMLVWIGYRTFIYDPSPIANPYNDAALTQPGAPEPKPSKDGEARFMFKRAQELSKNGHDDQAIAMLNRIVKVYKETPTAGEAQAAIDRADNDLPLFATGPIVVAKSGKPKNEPEPPPKAVVDATPSGGQATKGDAALVLPANAPEMVVVPPSARNAVVPGRSTTAAAAFASGVSGQSSGRRSRVGLAAGDQ